MYGTFIVARNYHRHIMYYISRIIRESGSEGFIMTNNQSGPQSVIGYIFRCVMVTKLNALNFLIGLIAILETSSLTTYILKYYMFMFFIITLYIIMFFN